MTNKVEFKIEKAELKEWTTLITKVKSREKQGDLDARKLVTRLHESDAPEKLLALKIRDLLNDLNKENITPEIKKVLGLDGLNKDTWAMLKLMTHEEYGKSLVERCVIADDYIDPKDKEGKRIILCLSPSLAGQYMHCKRVAGREGFRLSGSPIQNDNAGSDDDNAGSDDDAEVSTGSKTVEEIKANFLAFVADTDSDTIHEALEGIYNTLELQEQTG